MVVRRRCEHELARHEGYRAIRNADRRATSRDRLAVHMGDRQTVTVDVRVVAEHIDGRAAVFSHREAVVLSHRRIVDRRDRARDRRDRRDRAVRDRVGEARRTMVVRGLFIKAAPMNRINVTSAAEAVATCIAGAPK